MHRHAPAHREPVVWPSERAERVCSHEHLTSEEPTQRERGVHNQAAVDKIMACKKLRFEP